MSLREILSRYWRGFQPEFLEAVGETVGSLSDRSRLLLDVFEFVRVEKLIGPGSGPGRPAKDRVSLAHAFLAKAVFDLSSTRDLIERLASPRLVAAALRAPPAPASPSTGSRTAPCSRVRTGAGTTAIASGSELRTTACGTGRTARRSRAAAAPMSRCRRRQFPERRCWPIGCPGPPGRPWFSHPTHR